MADFSILWRSLSMRPATKSRKWPAAAGICHCTVWRVTSQSLSHFDSTSPGDLPWFWVQLLAVGTSGPSAYIDLFLYCHRTFSWYNQDRWLGLAFSFHFFPSPFLLKRFPLYRGLGRHVEWRSSQILDPRCRLPW